MTDTATPRIVDPHVHWWDRSKSWLVTATQEQADAYGMGDISGMNRTYLGEDYRADTAAFAVEKIVWVTATFDPEGQVAEVEWIDRHTAGDPLVAALIGTVDPNLPRAERVARFEAQAKAERFRGVRVLAGMDYASDNADEYMRMLADHGCVYDLVAHHPSMADAARLAERHPNVPFVLEHCGWPLHPDDPDDVAAWRAGITALAGVETVHCKISGLAMSLHTFDAEKQRPFVEHCLNSFGVERCMFASNFPVDALYGRYDEMVHSYLALTAGLGDDVRRRLFSGNAERLYRI